MTPEALREVRQSLGLSQREFGRLIGAQSVEHVCRMERGKNTITAATAIIAHMIRNPYVRAEIAKVASDMRAAHRLDEERSDEVSPHDEKPA